MSAAIPPPPRGPPPPVDIDTMWLGPADEAGQRDYLKFLHDVLLRRASDDGGLPHDGGPQNLPVRGAAAYTTERDAALDYLRRCGVRLGPVHPANSEMHGRSKFAQWRWVVALPKDSDSVEQKEFVEGCTSKQQLQLIAVSRTRRDGMYDLTRAPNHEEGFYQRAPTGHKMHADWIKRAPSDQPVIKIPNETWGEYANGAGHSFTWRDKISFGKGARNATRLEEYEQWNAASQPGGATGYLRLVPEPLRKNLTATAIAAAIKSDATNIQHVPVTAPTYVESLEKAVRAKGDPQMLVHELSRVLAAISTATGASAAAAGVEEPVLEAHVVKQLLSKVGITEDRLLRQEMWNALGRFGLQNDPVLVDWKPDASTQDTIVALRARVAELEQALQFCDTGRPQAPASGAAAAATTAQYQFDIDRRDIGAHQAEWLTAGEYHDCKILDRGTLFGAAYYKVKFDATGKDAVQTLPERALRRKELPTTAKRTRKRPEVTYSPSKAQKEPQMKTSSPPKQKRRVRQIQGEERDGEYYAAEDETPEMIAQRLGVSVEHLLQVNSDIKGLTKTSRLKAGTNFHIPVLKPVPE